MATPKREETPSNLPSTTVKTIIIELGTMEFRTPCFGKGAKNTPKKELLCPSGDAHGRRSTGSY